MLVTTPPNFDALCSKLWTRMQTDQQNDTDKTREQEGENSNILKAQKAYGRGARTIVGRTTAGRSFLRVALSPPSTKPEISQSEKQEISPGSRSHCAK